MRTGMRIGSILTALLLGLTACGELSDHSGPICAQLGDPGCPCTSAGTCIDQPGQRLTCQAGVCVAVACPAGTVGCTCVGGCGAGLICEAGLCAPGCVPGTPGCACYGGEQCDADTWGNPMVCLEGRCETPHCTLGALHCFCDAGGHCQADAICDDGLCVEDTGQTLNPPAEPKCWTPCRGGEVANTAGETVPCGADGLLAGCIGDTLCLHGSCVDPASLTPGAPVAPCAQDADCPTTQNCIDGGCFSDCELDGDCNGARVCHLRACRIPCTTPTDDGDECGREYRCDSEDGITGVCLPRAPEPVDPPATVAPPAGVPTGGMPVSPQRLVFTSQQTTGAFTLTNLTERRLPFTIRKTEHTIQRDSGHEQITEEPLHWLQMASETEGYDTHASLTVVLEPGASTAIRFAEPVAPDFPKWAGVLTVTAPGTADVPVHVGYLDSPAGQWTGTAYYLANFGTGQLAPWVSAVATDDEATAGTAVALVGNALVRRWWAFRRGSLSRDEFDAVLMAVTEESWKWPVSRAFCGNDNAACYPSDNLVGFSVLSDDLEASPVPSGLSQLDISLNLQPDGDDPRTWMGRVDSAHTLQYPGNPGITIKFEPLVKSLTSACRHGASDRDAPHLVSVLVARTQMWGS